MKPTAILLSGMLGYWRPSLTSILKNIALPSEADIFIVTSRRRVLRKAPATVPIVSADECEAWHKKSLTIVADDTQPINGKEIAKIADLLEGWLTSFFLVDEMPTFQRRVKEQRQQVADAIAAYQKESRALYKPVPCSGNFVPADDPFIGAVLDQYLRVRACYQLMQEREDHCGEKYKFVMRARPDMVAPYSWDIREFVNPPDALMLCGSVREDPMEWADEFCWFSNRETASKLFPSLDRMGSIVDRKYQTIHPGQKNDYRFTPETQFSLLLHELGLVPKVLPIYRSNQFTNEGQWDHMNYRFTEPLREKAGHDDKRIALTPQGTS